MRISDWSSDVCSSDLPQRRAAAAVGALCPRGTEGRGPRADRPEFVGQGRRDRARRMEPVGGWKASPLFGRSEERRVGKECVVRVAPGGRRIIKKKNKTQD